MPTQRNPIHSFILILYVMNPFFSVSAFELNDLLPKSSKNLEPREIAKKAFDALVVINALDNTGNITSLGSGFFLHSNNVVTNYHVIENGARLKIVNTKHGIEYNVKRIVAIDKKNDLAILEVDRDSPHTLPVSSSQALTAGEKIFAAGNPMGLEGTFSDGIVSSVRNNEGVKLIQITSPISSGSSGGPILNTRGEVVGIAVATLKAGQNLNFAIPVESLNDLYFESLGALEDLGFIAEETPKENKTPEQVIQGNFKDERKPIKGLKARGNITLAIPQVYKKTTWGMNLESIKELYPDGSSYESGEGLMRHTVYNIQTGPDIFPKAITSFSIFPNWGLCSVTTIIHDQNKKIEISDGFWVGMDEKDSNQLYVDMLASLSKEHGKPTAAIDSEPWMIERKTWQIKGADRDQGNLHLFIMPTHQDLTKSTVRIDYISSKFDSQLKAEARKQGIAIPGQTKVPIKFNDIDWSISLKKLKIMYPGGKVEKNEMRETDYSVIRRVFSQKSIISFKFSELNKLIAVFILFPNTNFEVDLKGKYLARPLKHEDAIAIFNMAKNQLVEKFGPPATEQKDHLFWADRVNQNVMSLEREPYSDELPDYSILTLKYFDKDFIKANGI